MRRADAIFAMLATLAVGMSWGMLASSRNLFPANAIRAVVGSRGEQAASRFIVAQSETQLRHGRRADILIVGDSLTSDIPWGEMLPNVASSAIRGSTTADVLARLPTIRERAPKRTIYLVGINDVDDGIPFSETMANFHRIIDGTPGQVVIVGLLPCSEALSKCPRLRRGADKINRELALLAYGRVAYVEPPALSDRDTYDGLHLNANGVGMLLRALKPHLT